MSYEKKELHPGDDGWFDLSTEGDDICLADGPAPDYYGCTRPEHHTGRHAAHGLDEQYATWDNEEDPEGVVEDMVWCEESPGIGEPVTTEYHPTTCRRVHRSLIVGEIISMPHRHTTQVMTNEAGVPVTVCCTGVDGCGMYENLSDPGWR